jgi:hypothetical protein
MSPARASLAGRGWGVRTQAELSEARCPPTCPSPPPAARVDRGPSDIIAVSQEHLMYWWRVPIVFSVLRKKAALSINNRD